MEIQRYLKTSREFDHGKEGIQRNTDIVQAVNKSVRKGRYTAGTKYHWIETQNGAGYTLDQSTGE